MQLLRLQVPEINGMKMQKEQNRAND